MNIQIPDIGDFDEVSVIEVLVKAGDTIKPEQSLITVESDKASMEIPSSHGGVVREILVKVGDMVKQGSVVLTLDVAGAVDETSTSESKQAEAHAKPVQTAIKTEAPSAAVAAPASASFAQAAILRLFAPLTLGSRLYWSSAMPRWAGSA